MEPAEITITPEYREAYNINPKIYAVNDTDGKGNPSGGFVKLLLDSGKEALTIEWQDGPRGDGETLIPANGAFVEDAIWAALQRLEFFQKSKYMCRANALAITHLEQALQALKDRQLERSYRGVEGKHEA